MARLQLAYPTLVDLLRRQGRIPEAEAVARDAVAVWGEAARQLPRYSLAREHLADSYTLLAGLCRAAEAEDLDAAALELRRTLLCDRFDDPATAAAWCERLIARAEALLSQGRAAEAEDLCRELLEHLRRAHPLGRDQARHFSLQATTRLGLVLAAQGRLAEAEACDRDVVAAYRDRIACDPLPRPWDRQDLLEAQSNLAALLTEAGRLEEALALALATRAGLLALGADRQRLRVHFPTWGQWDVVEAHINHNLGVALERAGHGGEAEA